MLTLGTTDPDRKHPTHSFQRNLSYAIILLIAGWTLPVAGASLPWHQEKGFRWAELPAGSGGKTGFTRLTPEATGIFFTNAAGDMDIARNRVLADGSGVAVGDFDHDGLPDIFFAALDGHCRLYRNAGDFKFNDVTARSGVQCTNYICRGAVFADINGDGWLDLLVTTTGNGVLVFSNKQDGTFADVSQSAGLLSSYGATTLALADVDGNGTLDVYVTTYRTENIRDRADISLGMVNGKISIPPALQDRLALSTHGNVLEYGEPDQLYLNDGRGTFTPVSWTNGAFLDEKGAPLRDMPRDWGLSAMFHDVNGDGAPDLYVCNDYWTPDRFWINDGKGHFRAAPATALGHTSASSMAVDFSDIDRDGHVDFMVVDMLSRDWGWRKRQKAGFNADLLPNGEDGNRPQVSRNTLFHNRGDGTFEEIAGFSGVAASEWSWQPVFLDVDLDGLDDILVVTGFHRDIQDRDRIEAYQKLQRANRFLPQKFAPDGTPVRRSRQELLTDGNFAVYSMENPLKTPIVAFHNRGGLKFDDAGREWGLDVSEIRNAISLGDLNNQGKLDFVVNTFCGASEVYRNDTVAPRVAVRLKALPPNTQGIGAKIKVINGAVPSQSAEVVSGGYYLSGADPLRVFAAGPSTNMALEITWRNGSISRIAGIKPNRIYEVDEKAAVPPTPAPVVEKTQPLFKDVSGLIAHTHHEEAFNDFERQPLLPYRLSQDGPGVAWIALDGGKPEALVTGSGRGGRWEAFFPDGKGAFNRVKASDVAADDLTGLAEWIRPDGTRSVLIGQAHYESANNLPSLLLGSYETGALRTLEQLAPTEASAGPIAVADVRGDGHLNVFVGGRVIPGRYPEAADSAIYRHDGKKFVLDAENSKVLEKAGLVSGAVWSDLDGDGYPELILACEWGPIRVFKNERGRLREITRDLGLDRYTGWWRGVTTGDIDGDGRPDIVAANWGLNSDYRASQQHPLALYYGDFGDRGVDDLIETVYDPALHAVVARRNRPALEMEFPFLVESFPTHENFSQGTIEQILAALPKPARKVEATTLASTIFFNRTNRFDAIELPYAAQVAPAFGVNVADFAGDGNEDIFLSQNFFQVQSEEPRLDAGRGLLLRNLGGGRLAAVPGQESGILIYGEQRGSACGDFDEDGRVDLAVAQNGGETRLYKNLGAKPGLRVRLKGPPGNPDGISAAVRLMFGRRFGPVREVHGGSGYWSQDSPVQVLSGPEAPTQLWVRWPGGKTTVSDIPPHAGAVMVDQSGKLTEVNSKP